MIDPNAPIRVRHDTDQLRSLNARGEVAFVNWPTQETLMIRVIQEALGPHGSPLPVAYRGRRSKYASYV